MERSFASAGCSSKSPAFEIPRAHRALSTGPADIQTPVSSAASAANAAIDHIHDWVLGTNGKWVTMGVPSKGDYGIPEGTMYGFPVTCENGQYTIVQGLEIDEFSRSKMDATLAELEEEKAGVAHLLG